MIRQTSTDCIVNQPIKLSPSFWKRTFFVKHVPQVPFWDMSKFSFHMKARILHCFTYAVNRAIPKGQWKENLDLRQSSMTWKKIAMHEDRNASKGWKGHAPFDHFLACFRDQMQVPSCPHLIVAAHIDCKRSSWFENTITLLYHLVSITNMM